MRLDPAELAALAAHLRAAPRAAPGGRDAGCRARPHSLAALIAARARRFEARDG